jgi:putative ABC transport system permease protein
MFKNYFKIAIRNLVKNKLYAFISISGLAIGLAVCIMLLMYIKHEISYDRFHDRADHIYRLCQPQHPYHAPQTARLLADNLPEIKDFTRILYSGSGIVQYKENKFKEDGIAFADASFFRIFSFTFTQGDPQTALQPPSTVVISEKLARKYFGAENPIGHSIKLDNELNFTVSGVMKDMPSNSHFHYDIIMTLTAADRIFTAKMMNNWGWENFLVYFLMQDQFSHTAFKSKCNQIIAARRGIRKDEAQPDFSLQNLKDIHLYSAHLASDRQPQNSISAVLIFSAIGLLILLIACFNYINLLTAQAIKRAKEIGIRKVVGASRRHLAAQFIGESFVVLTFSLLLALALVVLWLPVFNALLGKTLPLPSLFHVQTMMLVLAIVFATGILAGSYPAFFLSTIQPAKTLKESVNASQAKFNFRKMLVGAQFAVVIILISCAFFMSRQTRFLQHKELGFDKEYVLTADEGMDADVEKFNALKQALLKESTVKNVSAASRVPADALNNLGDFRPEGQAKPIRMPCVHVHYDYFETLGIAPSQGRLFSSQFKTDAEEAVVINEAAVNKLELRGNPIGQTIKCSWPDSTRRIVGIVDDFHFESLYKTIRPVVFVLHFKECSQLMVKVRPSNTKTTIDRLAAICSRFYPLSIFEFHFVDDRLEAIYRKDQNTFRIMGYFAMLAIAIACMGLFGLGTIMIRSRTKEIGVRKVLGAPLAQLLLLLTGDFAKWVLVANILAWPVAYFAMKQWLQHFPYRIDMTIGPFLLSAFITLAIALLTVGWHALKAAQTSPIVSLKYE